MRVLCAIVLTQASGPMTIADTKTLERRTIGSQSVSDDSLRLDILILQ